MTAPADRTDAALDRVRKLLALATSDNPHEAALAASRAQAIIETHRLQRWLDAEQAVHEDPDPIVDARDEPLEVARKIRRFKSALASVLADANGCVAYTLDTPTPDQPKACAIVLVGRARDRAAVTALWDWLVKRIEWLSATHGAKRSKKWHDAFRLGVVDAVAERLRESSTERRASLDATALVIVDPAEAAHREALDRFVADVLHLGPGRSVSIDGRAWAWGKRASEDLDLP
jgi:hypothetical protein